MGIHWYIWGTLSMPDGNVTWAKAFAAALTRRSLLLVFSLMGLDTAAKEPLVSRDVDVST